MGNTTSAESTSLKNKDFVSEPIAKVASQIHDVAQITFPFGNTTATLYNPLAINPSLTIDLDTLQEDDSLFFDNNSILLSPDISSDMSSDLNDLSSPDIQVQTENNECQQMLLQDILPMNQEIIEEIFPQQEKPAPMKPENKSLKDLANSDGFRWTVYGTKVSEQTLIKKTYFKCLFKGCKARKSMSEIKRTDTESEITTNKISDHNHEPLGFKEKDVTSQKDLCEFLKFHSKNQSKIILRVPKNIDPYDDGFRWKKYGKKKVKNSEYPRGYYRCVTPGCTAKKQLDENSDCVVSTYQGIHAHNSCNKTEQFVQKKQPKEKTETFNSNSMSESSLVSKMKQFEEGFSA